MLLSLVEDGLISKYVFIHIPETTSDLQGSKQVQLRADASLLFRFICSTYMDYPHLVSCKVITMVEKRQLQSTGKRKKVMWL